MKETRDEARMKADELQIQYDRFIRINSRQNQLKEEIQKRKMEAIQLKYDKQDECG